MEIAEEKKLRAYVELISKWNKVYNLTAIKDPEDMWIKHILDSVSLLPYLKGSRSIDVGTGAGLPGIPLALSLPDHHFVLLDARVKKTRFLQQVKQELSLSNVEIINQRVEEYYPEQAFDNVITRAFSQLDDMLYKTSHLCSNNGQFLAMKGVLPELELKQVGAAYLIESVNEINVPLLDGERHVVVIKKDIARLESNAL